MEVICLPRSILLDAGGPCSRSIASAANVLNAQERERPRRSGFDKEPKVRRAEEAQNELSSRERSRAAVDTAEALSDHLGAVGRRLVGLRITRILRGPVGLQINFPGEGICGNPTPTTGSQTHFLRYISLERRPRGRVALRLGAS